MPSAWRPRKSAISSEPSRSSSFAVAPRAPRHQEPQRDRRTGGGLWSSSRSPRPSARRLGSTGRGQDHPTAAFLHRTRTRRTSRCTHQRGARWRRSSARRQAASPARTLWERWPGFPTSIGSRRYPLCPSQRRRPQGCQRAPGWQTRPDRIPDRGSEEVSISCASVRGCTRRWLFQIQRDAVYGANESWPQPRALQNARTVISSRYARCRHRSGSGCVHVVRLRPWVAGPTSRPSDDPRTTDRRGVGRGREILEQ